MPALHRTGRTRIAISPLAVLVALLAAACTTSSKPSGHAHAVRHDH